MKQQKQNDEIVKKVLEQYRTLGDYNEKLEMCVFWSVKESLKFTIPKTQVQQALKEILKKLPKMRKIKGCSCRFCKGDNKSEEIIEEIIKKVFKQKLNTEVE